MVPSAVLDSRIAQVSCSTQNLPTLDFSSLASTQNFLFDSSSTAYSINTDASSRFIFPQPYVFTLPAVTSADIDVYEFQAVLGTHFITGGSVGLLLREHNDTLPTDLSCYTVCGNVLFQVI